jgi:O-antigen/teichoic acid export membrane protein
MKNLVHSDWRISVMALATLIGTFIAIFVVKRELNLTFAIWYLVAFVLVVAGNATYVFYKRKKNNR